MSSRDFPKRNRQTSRGRSGRPREDRLNLDELRKETARRAIVVAGKDPLEVPMVVAVCALLTAGGRADFSENEIRAEVEKLAGELRSRYGFTDPERAAGAELWTEVLDLLNASEIPDSTLGLWVRPLHSPGLAGRRLWLTSENEGVAAWAARRYRGVFNEAIELRRPEQRIEVGFMALDSREDGQL